MALLRESRGMLEDVIKRDTSGRGATTALAHHALGELYCVMFTGMIVPWEAIFFYVPGLF